VHKEAEIYVNAYVMAHKDQFTNEAVKAVPKTLLQGVKNRSIVQPNAIDGCVSR
jgi:hypothetical protein